MDAAIASDGERRDKRWVRAILDAMRSLAAYKDEAVSGADAIGAVLRYVEAHPEIRSEPAAVTVYVALAAAWPCPG